MLIKPIHTSLKGEFIGKVTNIIGDKHITFIASSLNGTASNVEVHITSEDHYNQNKSSKQKQIVISLLDFIKLEVEDILFASDNSLKILFKNCNSDCALLVTEECNNNCLMCSQPPKKKYDSQRSYQINSAVVSLLPSICRTVCLTGGEPTTHFIQLLQLIDNIQAKCPDSMIHILSNGRIFHQKQYAFQLSKRNSGNLLLGIPINSDVFYSHDYITQARDSFNQTLVGLYNLALFSIRIEIRVVISRLNYVRLPNIAEFIYKNFPFVEHVAFMALEYTGNAVNNSSLLQIDPACYQEELHEAIYKLHNWGLNVSIYNIPLCQLNPSLFNFHRKSLSKWKMKFIKECEECILIKECCGLFATSEIDCMNIKPFVQ